MSEVDSFRFSVLARIAEVNSFRNTWPTFELKLREILGDAPTGLDVYNLGSHLAEVFRSNAVIGRDNSALSQGGTVWECLIAWYMNLVFHGTDVVVIRPIRELTPNTVREALSVTISNHKTNTESDLIAFSVPTGASAVENALSAALTMREIDLRVSGRPTETDVTVIQCKTNWNDNAQIPMLWDLIYATESFRVANVSVGSSGASPASFRRFSYAFVTVPTSRGPFTPERLSTLRVKNLSGGNYWGSATSAGVARSISDFFVANFASHFHGTVQHSVQRQMNSHPDLLQKYLSLDFA